MGVLAIFFRVNASGVRLGLGSRRHTSGSGAGLSQSARGQVRAGRPDTAARQGARRIADGRFAAATWDLQNQHATLGNSTDPSGRLIMFNAEVPREFDDVNQYSTPAGLMQIMR